MCYTGLFKRIIPFILTFAVGLFIASFFVSIAFPGERWRSERRANRVREMERLVTENENLRIKLRETRLENEQLKRTKQDWTEAGEPTLTPSDEFDEHHPPPPPRKPKHPRFE